MTSRVSENTDWMSSDLLDDGFSTAMSKGYISRADTSKPRGSKRLESLEARRD